MYADDQRDRRDGPEDARCLLNAVCDKERQALTLEIIKAGELKTANDYFHAAMIFQHSWSPEDNMLAYSLASIAARIDPTHKSAKWFAAAAWDRTLVNRNKRQWYGTQFVKNSSTGKWELAPVEDGAVSDEERARAGVPSLAASRERVKKMNGE